MGRIVFNDYLDATLAALSVAIVVTVVVYAAVAIRKALATPGITAIEIGGPGCGFPQVIRVRTIWRGMVRGARLMVGVPDYETYVAHRKSHHADEPVMTYEEFFRERQIARYACDRGRFKGCC